MASARVGVSSSISTSASLPDRRWPRWNSAFHGTCEGWECRSEGAEAQLLPFHLRLNHRAGLEVAGQYPLGQRVLYPALDGALERPGAVYRVVADGDELVDGLLAQLQVQVPFSQALAQALHLDIGDAGDLILAQRLEHHHFVHPVDELGAEVLAQGIHHRGALGLRIPDPFLV